MDCRSVHRPIPPDDAAAGFPRRRISAFASRLHAENGIENARTALPDLSWLSAVSGNGFPTCVHGAEAGISAIRAGPPGSFLGPAAQPDSVRDRPAGRAFPPPAVRLGYWHGGCTASRPVANRIWLC